MIFLFHKNANTFRIEGKWRYRGRTHSRENGCGGAMNERTNENNSKNIEGHTITFQQTNDTETN